MSRELEELLDAESIVSEVEANGWASFYEAIAR
jgi:hypothetical protein